MASKQSVVVPTEWAFFSNYFFRHQKSTKRPTFLMIFFPENSFFEKNISEGVGKSLIF